MDVGEICTRSVISARADEPITVAATRLRRFHVGDLVVLDPGHAAPRPVGILTDRDITVAVVAEAPDALQHLTCADLVRAPLVSVDENEDVFVAVERMSEAGVRRLPVVDERGDLVGILALDDLYGLLARTLAALAGISRDQREREWEGRP